MTSRFDACLALTLREETGSAQPPGGPFVRLVVTDWYNRERAKRGERPLPKGRYFQGESGLVLNGVAYPYPEKPDGFWFDDDPHDTGGRTAAGILQREFNAYCDRCAAPRRDVWTITDDELRTIYHEQYWRAVQGDSLPPGVDAFVFDSAVLQGVSAATKHLQEVLGLRIDGHMGQVTIAAAQAADSADLIARLAERRRKYLRGCRTFWKHGTGWLKRVDRVEAAARSAATVIARAMAETRAVGLHRMAADPQPVDLPVDAGPPLSRKATSAREPVPPSSRPAPIVTGTAGLGLSGDGIAEVFAKAVTMGGISVETILAAALSTPSLWGGVIVLAGSLWWWIGPRWAVTAQPAPSVVN